MFLFYAFLVSIFFCLIDLLYLRIFQLENYKIKNYFKKIYKINIFKFEKNQLKFTKRIKRHIFIDFLIKFLIFLIIFLFLNNFLDIILTILLFLIFSPLIACFSFLISCPIEILIKNQYIKKARIRLKEVGAKVVAITGSFGKTSTKNFLYQILKGEFEVCVSPQSFNTPMGICKTILENLKDTDEFVIFEYGARHVGDIEFLAKNFGVDFGIITPIGSCHLETFETIENIENEKFQLCKNAKEFVVFNGKSDSSKRLYKLFDHKKYLVCENDSFAFAKDVVISENGTNFVLCIDKNEIECKTKILGCVGIDNIVTASVMAYLLGETLYTIQKEISRLKPASHRMELIKTERVLIIDDSFNSNFTGFSDALNVLGGFSGRKIVISPGMVELGVKQYEQNFEIGRKISKVCDILFVSNKTNRDALFKGAISGEMKENQIFFGNTREDQQKFLRENLKEGDVVLFENDFPDNIR